VDGERRAPPALDRDRPAEEAGDRRSERLRPASSERDLLQPRLEDRRLAVELRAMVHEEPDRAPFDRRRIARTGPQHGHARLGCGREQRLGASAALAAGILHQDEPGDPRLGDRPDHGSQRLGVGRDDGERAERDDRDVARLEGVEGRDPGAHQADPDQVVGFAGRRHQPARPGQDRRSQTLERRHRRGGYPVAVGAAGWAARAWRLATRSSSSRANSRSTST
jgi:hypothetical protein